MDELVKSIQIWLKEKTGSPLYFTYIAFLVVWNWKFFYVLLWENASLFKSPKIEYISQNIDVHFCSKISIDPWCSISEWLTNTIWHMAIPVGLTYIAIKYLPKVHAWAHQIHVQNHFDRLREFDRQNLLYEEDRTNSLVKEVKQKKEQKTAKNEIQESLTEEERWEEEYKEFSKGNLLSSFKQVIDAIYENSGRIHEEFTGRRNVDSDTLANADIRSLIYFTDNDRSKIEFTAKGKYFAKKYLERDALPF